MKAGRRPAAMKVAKPGVKAGRWIEKGFACTVVMCQGKKRGSTKAVPKVHT